MIDRFTAETQARITYLILGGYFALKLMEGLHWLSPVSADLKEVVLLAATFWLMRQRNQEKPNA